MAKDGTRRGGARVGAGRKPKALTEKIVEGREMFPGDLPEPSELDAADAPPIKDFLKAQEGKAGNLKAEEVYNEIWTWLKRCGCEKYVPVQLIEKYALSTARWIQCEEMITQYGFLGKHPTTGAAIASPLASLAQGYSKQVDQAWYEIYQIVKENSLGTTGAAGTQDDIMERLLRTKKG